MKNITNLLSNRTYLICTFLFICLCFVVYKYPSTWLGSNMAVGGIFLWFKNIFAKVDQFWKKLMNKAKPFMQKQIPVAIGIVNVLKQAVENPAIDFATQLTKTNLDNQLVAKGRDILPELLIQLRLLDIAAQTDSNTKIFEAVITYLRSIAPEKRYGKYLEIANYLTQALTDGKLQWNEIVHLVQLAHDEKGDAVLMAA